jgi:hypothetical protein
VIKAVQLGCLDQAVEHRGPPLSDPAKVQFRRPKATGRMARSAAELSMQARRTRTSSATGSTRRFSTTAGFAR